MPAYPTAARLVADALIGAGIRHAFTVPGESFLGLLDALRDGPIEVVAARHEAGAGFMAEGYAQLTGRPAACLVTRAVGASNLAIALHSARQDSAPLVALVGQVRRDLRGREAFQEVDLVATFGGLCKAAAELDDPATMADEVRRLVRLARSGRPGPVLVSLPQDALEETVEVERRAPDVDAWEPERPAPSADQVRRVLGRLARARRPVLVAGGGIRASGATGELVAFADAAELPVIAGWRRTDVFPNDHPRYLGSTGLSAPPTVRDRLAEADVVVAIGTRLSEVATFGYEVPSPGAELVVVDVAPGTAADRPRPSMIVEADARAFLAAALDMLGRRSRERGDGLLPSAGLAEARAEDLARDRAAFLAASALPLPPDPTPATGLVDPAAVVRALHRHLAPGAIVTTDAGNFAGWAARHLPVAPQGRFIGPTSGAMGYALPAAIGAGIGARVSRASAGPIRIGMPNGGAPADGAPQLVALAGDGGLAMLVAELETAVREQLRLAVLVFDNRMYGTIRAHQEAAFPGRAVATDLGPIDFAAIGEACGARGLRVERDDDVEAAVEEALRHEMVTVVHLLVDPRFLSVDRILPGWPPGG